MSERTESPQSAGTTPLRPLGDAVSLLVVALAIVIVICVASEVLGWRPLATRSGSAIVLLTVGALVAALAVHMRGNRESRDLPPRRRWVLRLVAGGPALVLALYAVGALFLPTAARVEWFLNGDHVRHLVLVADERARGALSYETRVYPRGWHSAVALLWSITTGAAGRVDVAGLIDLMSTAAWMLSSALALATATLTAAVGMRVGLTTTPACVTGGLVAAATLWPSYLGNYQALGLESSLVAAIVLAVCLRELLERLGSWSAFLVCAAGLVVMGHTWQLLLPVSGAAAVAAAWAVVRAGGRARAVGVGGVLLASSLAVLPSLTAVASKVGVGHAAVADIVAPVPVLTLAGAVVSTAYLVWRHRSDRRLLVVLALVVLPAVTSVALAARVGVPLSTYYPAKLLWHSAALGLAACGALAGTLWIHLGARPSPLTVTARSAMGAAGVLCVLGAFWAPSAAFRGAWSTADGSVVLSLIGVEGAERATVVWSDGRLNTDAVTRIVLDAYKPEASRADTAQQRLDVSGDCLLLRAASDPVILSNRSPAEVRARYTCAPDAVIVTP